MSSSTEELKRLFYQEVLPKLLPFSDVATRELPLARLLRLALFQASVGMMMVLLYGTLNRVMVVEKGVPPWLIGLMVALPVLVAPFRALIGFKSDHHKSAFGWRRVPYIWFGTLMQFGGLAIMPFALLLMAEGGSVPTFVTWLAAGFAFLVAGAGLHTTQTAGLALATDLANEETRPRVIALLFVVLNLSMLVASLVFGALLSGFDEMSVSQSNQRLIGVLQGAALVAVVFNMVALWKQESINRDRVEQIKADRQAHKEPPRFAETWAHFIQAGSATRLLVALGLGTAGFQMQDILLEPYGGQVLGLTVSQTTRLTAVWALGTLAAFGLAAYLLGRRVDYYRISVAGALIGILAFIAVIAADPLGSPLLFRFGALLIGFGGGLFAVGTLSAAMNLADVEGSGLALGAWGAVQATAYGLAMFLGGTLRDLVTTITSSGAFGEGLIQNQAVGYAFVYNLEILLLFATLIAIGPLALKGGHAARSSSKFGLTELP
ncbi:MFS transporter [Lamprobacter modestohalophilus]|uniref:MFS transporter n=1 Tax=Lamprobacter modestohalophilus TaxID=1064514 RepID=A0A9X0W9T6_9GAMM|nr:BCD family MFS transporter [Lamprobacter modestohalophilus]MCF7977725.1 BCD family MFS transporter [Chromatiaceae bacterium]MBK1619645.1 MFS transporter [Lamprobacter modestohalophilus]MCF7994666.1 BCD family MFS transporter [Chromatiaceae bacterium]MCF8004626.1 BCD family MFS transporter [Chromatiaceae bacterium]MCF8016200.1 BCD family MFS transporter [Chromatiaceae bacterium]